MPPCGQCNSGTAETASVLYLTHPVLSRPFLRFLKNFPAAACGLQTLNAQLEVARQGRRDTVQSPARAFDKPNSARCAATAPLRLFAKLSCRTGGKRLTKPRKWGIVKIQRVLPVGRLPQDWLRDNRYFGEWAVISFCCYPGEPG